MPACRGSEAGEELLLVSVIGVSIPCLKLPNLARPVDSSPLQEEQAVEFGAPTDGVNWRVQIIRADYPARRAGSRNGSQRRFARSSGYVEHPVTLRDTGGSG